MSQMKRITAVLFSALIGGLAAQDGSSGKPVLAEIEDLSRALEQITGLKFTKRVPAAVIGKDELRRYLNSRVEKTAKPAELRAEELTLKMLGLVPRDFDLRRQTVDLLTEQAAAFYDYHKKKLYVLADETDEAGRMALAHELAHALADQHFHLEKYLRGSGSSDDAATARLAVMEGQATWLMMAYMQGGDSQPSPDLLRLSGAAVRGEASQYPVFSQAPLYIRESLVFPYTAGLSFQDAVYRRLKRDAFAQVFRRAPVSTQQILHPEKYLAGDDPLIPRPPAPEKFHGRKLAEGTLGEFDWRVLLTEYAGKPEAEALAPDLLGSAYALREGEGTLILSVAARWRTPEAARRCFAGYREILRKKSVSFELQLETPDRLEGRNAAGRFTVMLSGGLVESLEGLR
jgi:hypothetical protein